MADVISLSQPGKILREELLEGRPIGSLRINFHGDPSRESIHLFVSDLGEPEAIGYRFRLSGSFGNKFFKDHIQWAYRCYKSDRKDAGNLWILEVKSIDKAYFDRSLSEFQQTQQNLAAQLARAVGRSKISGKPISSRMETASKVLKSYSELEWKN